MYCSWLVFKIYFVLYYWLAQWPRLFHIFLKFQIWNEGGYVVFGTLCKHSYIYSLLYLFCQLREHRVSASIALKSLSNLCWIDTGRQFVFSHWQDTKSYCSQGELRRYLPPLTADISINSRQVRTHPLIIIINIRLR